MSEGHGTIRRSSDGRTVAAPLTRRAFLKAASAGGAALIVGVELTGLADVLAGTAGDERGATATSSDGFAPNLFVRVDADGAVTVTVPRSELGQGARTALPMILAEELEADWRAIRVEPALAHPDRYGSMTTGGSTSVRQFYGPLRKAGATAREMLREAAARTWSVPVSDCEAVAGAVVHGASGRRLSYGALVALAATLAVPEEPPLKDPRQFKLIGTSPARLDTPEKLSGAARFGLDTRRPGMLFAAVARCPVFGGKARRWDAPAAKAVTGVRDVVEIDTGIAVLATSTWAAMQGREALRVEWDEGENTTLDSASIQALFDAKLAEDSPDLKAYRDDGDFAQAFAGAARKLTATYELPFLAHAPLEPMNCLADFRKDAIEVWAPTQAPQWALGQLTGTYGLPHDQIKIHTTLSGGAFGRRLMPDFVLEAVQVSKAAGAPVQVVWSRADDMQHDWYRPASRHRLAAGLDAGGRIVAWRHSIAAPSIIGQVMPGRQPDEPDAIDGAATITYAIPNLRIEYAMVNTAVPIGWWRSVYNTQNPLANECFLDEIAVAAGFDPLALRLALLPADSRLRGVLQRAADSAGWSARPPAGHGRGLACHECFGSAAATVAEVSVTAGRIKVHRLWTAIDCGLAVHIEGVKAQVEGGAVMALTALLHGAITIERGQVQQTNFDGYPLLTIGDAPDVHVEILQSGEPIGGIGEPGLPPVAPAVLNAVFAATGQRVRRLPARLA